MLSQSEKIFLSIMAQQIRAGGKVSRADKQAILDLCARENVPVPAQLKFRMRHGVATIPQESD